MDCVKYNDTFEAVSWENCTARKWLREQFYNTAFSDLEKSMICDVTNEGVVDNVFLLSADEAKKYFKTDKERIASCTIYAINNGAYGSIGDLYCYWWLRSSGKDEEHACVVGYAFGSIGEDGFPVNYGKMTARPALWLRVEE